MTHAELVQRAGAWLRGTIRCSVVLLEHSSGVEHPDAFGFRGSHQTWMVECKASQSDFYKDKKKPSRRAGFKMRMAFQCYYLVPAGLIQPGSIPEGWGLLYAESRRIRVIKFAEPRSRHHQEARESRWANPLTNGFPPDDRDPYARSLEMNLLYQEVRRYQAQGIKYKAGKELWGPATAPAPPQQSAPLFDEGEGLA